jgi:hypothetical protein
MAVPAREAAVALMTSAGLYLKDTQEPFDDSGAETPMGRSTYAAFTQRAQDQIAASHLPQYADFYIDFNVALPIDAEGWRRRCHRHIASGASRSWVSRSGAVPSGARSTGLRSLSD